MSFNNAVINVNKLGIKCINANIHLPNGFAQFPPPPPHSTRPHVQLQLPCYCCLPSLLPLALNVSPPGGAADPASVFTLDTLELTAMRAAILLVLLLPLLCFSVGEDRKAEQSAAAAREYYIAAVEIGWDYVYLDDVDPASDQRWIFSCLI